MKEKENWWHKLGRQTQERMCKSKSSYRARTISDFYVQTFESKLKQ